MTKDYFTLLKKAEKGDCHAQFNVGHYYYRLREFKKAYSWWLKCSKHNKYLGPLFNIGNLYYNGWGLKQDIKKALLYFQLVIKNENIFSPKKRNKYVDLALYLIGKTYFEGTFIKKNKKKGLDFYKKAAMRGNTNAIYTLSLIYGNKEDGDYNFNKYIYYLKKTAKAGLSMAHAELAVLYFKKNKKLFSKHYKEAMKKDKKIIDKLELTSIARDGLISMTESYRTKLKKLNLELQN
jgi:TPR repeat protein